MGTHTERETGEILLFERPADALSLLPAHSFQHGEPIRLHRNLLVIGLCGLTRSKLINTHILLLQEHCSCHSHQSLPKHLHALHQAQTHTYHKYTSGCITGAN